MAKGKKLVAEAESLVVVIELEEAANGTKRLGNSIQVPKAEAIQGIRDERYKAEFKSRGVVPSEWEGGAEEVTVVAAEAVEVNGIEGNE